MSRVYLLGATGRLGAVVKKTLEARGDELVEYPLYPFTVAVNYLIFAHRYRGPASFRNEMEANVAFVWNTIESANWAEGDRAIVIVSSIDATDPNQNQSLAYNCSKAAQVNLARWYAKVGPVRCNTVSPATFTGDNPRVSKQQVADVIAFLCSPAASGINGQDIRVTG